MAIIDLDLGTTTENKDEEGQVVTPQQSSGMVIDLESGGMIQASQPPMQTAKQPTKQRGWTDMFTGSERIAETPELGTLPEFGGTEEGDTLKTAIGMLSTFDPKSQIEMIQQSIPEAVFETTPDGSTIIEVPTAEGGTRRSVLNTPGFSPQDLTTAMAQVLSFVPAARLVGLGKTVLSKLALGGTAAGLTEQALQETGVALGRKERDPLGTGIATVTGGLAEVVAPAIQGIRGLRQGDRVVEGAEEIAQVSGNIDAAREASKETGIPLFQAQQTGIPAQLEKQSFVAQLPAGTQSSIAGLKSQNKAAGDAVDSYLEMIAPDNAVITGAEKIRTAAQAAVEKTKSIRREKASPLYTEAFESGRKVNTLPVKELIADKLLDTPPTGQIAVNLKKALGFVEDSPNLKNLHNAKLEIDQIIHSRGDNAIGGTTKKELLDVQRLLLEQMDSASPTYKSARAAFEAASPPVTAMQDSIIGKIASLDDNQLKSVASKIFDPSQTNPRVIRDAKNAITDVNPEAWDEIVRVELERRLGSIKSTAEGGTIENIPGQMYRALFPNDKSTKVLMSALDEDGKKSLKYLQTALGRARLGRPGGSQTAAREEIKQELRGGVVQSVRQFFKSPVTTLASTGEDVAFNSRVAALAKAMYDPTWKAEMKAITKLNPDTPAAGRALTQLLNDIGSSEKDEEL